MLWFWWIYGSLLAAVTLVFVIDTYLGMPQVARLDRAPWENAPPAGPKLSVIVPARNEAAGVRACLESLLAQDYRDLEVIAVDDRSEDSTGAIMDELARRDPRLRVIHVRELPPGWLGKPHAMWTGANRASGSWLLFTDGDVIFDPHALARAIHYAEQTRADHLVVMPSFIVQSSAEYVPLAVFQFSVVGVRPWKVPDPRSRVHLGAGAFNMIRRPTYDRIGTFAVLCHEIVEDLAVGRLVKEAGLHSRVAIAPGLVRLHWFAGAFGIARALTKNVYAFLGFRWYLAVALALLVVAYHIAPFACVWLAPGWSKIGFVISLTGMFALYARLYPATRVNPLFFFVHPLGALLILYAAMKSMFVTVRDGGVTWRGTFYPTAMFKTAASGRDRA
jgi:glycosyltransferase involved in cell wall biosynthesis